MYNNTELFPKYWPEAYKNANAFLSLLRRIEEGIYHFSQSVYQANRPHT